MKLLDIYFLNADLSNDYLINNNYSNVLTTGINNLVITNGRVNINYYAY